MLDNEQELTTQVLTKENHNYTTKEIMIINTMKRIKNPYKNLTVTDIAKDLNIGINKAYEIFKRHDFPSIEIGKQKTVTLLAYLLWKMEKHK